MSFSLASMSPGQLYDHLKGVWLRAQEKYGKVGQTQFEFQESNGRVNLLCARGFSPTKLEPVHNTNNTWDDTLFVIFKKDDVKCVEIYEISTEQNTGGATAVLLPEMHLYYLGHHKVRRPHQDLGDATSHQDIKGKKYRALKPTEGVLTFRETVASGQNFVVDGEEAASIHRNFSINIHFGGSAASPAGQSEGCQVLRGFDRYKAFIKLVESDQTIVGTDHNELSPAGSGGTRSVVYCLVLGTELAPAGGEYYFPIDVGSGILVNDASVAGYFEHTEKTIPAGFFPLGTNTVWHGGVHIHKARASPVHAIADGTLIGARLLETDPTGDDRYGSRNFLLLKHEVSGDRLIAANGRKLLKLRVIKDGLAVRGGPAKGAAYFAQLKLGDELEPTSQETIQADGLSWFAIKISKSSVAGMTGRRGYVASLPEYLGEDREPPAPGLDPKQVYVFFSLYMHLNRERIDASNEALRALKWIRSNSPAAPGPAPAGSTTGAGTESGALRIREPVSLKGEKDKIIGWFDTGALVTKIGSTTGLFKIKWEAGAPGVHFNSGVTPVTQGYVTSAGKYVEPAPGASPGADSDVQHSAAPSLNSRIAQDLKSGSVVRLDLPIKAGEQLWTSGTYGPPGSRTPLTHWEIFSQHNLFPRWKKAEDADENFTMDCKEILSMVEQEYWGSDATLTAEEIQAFYRTNSKALSLRRTACRFCSEWGLDVDKAVSDLQGAWLTAVTQFFGVQDDLADKIKPYQFWHQLAEAGGPLPSSPLTWHYNPVAVMDALRGSGVPIAPVKPAPPPPTPEAVDSGEDYNDEVLKVARSKNGGGYTWKKGDPSSGDGVPETIVHKGTTVLERPANGASYCCGFTFWVFMKVAQENELLTNATFAQVRNAQKQWFIGTSALDGPTKALEGLGIGKGIDKDSAKAGDFLQIWRTDKDGNLASGHSVVFLEWVEGKKKIKYRSTQPATDGIGDRVESTNLSGGQGTLVNVDKCYFARLTGRT